MSFSLINILFTGLFIVGALILWFRTKKLHQKLDWEESKHDEVLLSVSVPKNNDRTPQAAEQMFAALHGIFREGAATQSRVSFEIVSKDKSIKFYVYAPADLKDFVISQIFAQYPTVEIHEVEKDNDYTKIAETKAIAETEISLKKPTVYPIKTFQNFDVDPLSGITGVLSAVSDQEEIWIQILVRPADDSWQDMGKDEIKKIKNPTKAVKTSELIIKEVKSLGIDLAKAIISGPPGEVKKEDKKPEEMGGPESNAIKAIEEKITKLGYETKIRILAAANDAHIARAKLEQAVGAFKQFNALNLNSLATKEIKDDKQALDAYQHRTMGETDAIFNVTELASLYHFPSETVATPTIAWAGSKKGEPPANLPIVGSVPADELTVFAQTNFRNEIKKFGIKKKDRRLHTYVIGKTGTGKSTLLENMIIDDINEGRGLAVVDPHGTLIQHVLEFIPESRVDDVIYFNPADHERPVGFNLLENVNPEQKNIVASGVVGILEKIFGEVSWGPRLEYILRNVILALLEYPNSTFLGIMRLLTDNAYRRLVLNEVKDPIIRDFFINEYEKYEPKFRNEAIAPIQNKVGQFLSSSTIRNIIGQPKSTVDIRQVMDEGKILLADLSIGKIGEDNSALLGSMLITKIQLAAMGRVDIPEDERRDFYLYVDEFQNFATSSFATILSEARKYRLNLAMANQYTAQMPETVSNAVFGNVGTIVSFRVGAGDAASLTKEYEPIFDANDLVNLDNYQIYLKMAIDGVTVPAFSAGTLPPRTDKTNLVETIVERSRKNYTRSSEEVEDYVTEWSTPVNLGAESTVATKPPHEQIKTQPKEQPTEQPTEHREEKMGESPESKEPAPRAETENGGELQKEIEHRPAPTLPEGSKVQIIKDRFDRPWYAMTNVAGEHYTKEPEPKIDTPDIESREVGEQKDQLITWEQAEELDIKAPSAPNSGPIEDSLNQGSDDGLTPLDEIR